MDNYKILKSVEVYINGYIHDKYYVEWMEIYNDLVKKENGKRKHENDNNDENKPKKPKIK